MFSGSQHCEHNVAPRHVMGIAVLDEDNMNVPNVPNLAAQRPVPAFLFDLDGTLVDSVYQHVLAWREALEDLGIELAVWRIHRRIGMSGGLLIITRCFVRIGRGVTQTEADHLARLHEEAYSRLRAEVRVLPGASELLAHLLQSGIPVAIATSGWPASAQPMLQLLQVSSDIPVITRDQVDRAKPDPDLFLAAAKGLGVPIHQSIVVGDSVWDLLAARRANALGVGLLSGGYGQDELSGAGAYRVYQDPADLLRHLDEVGVRAIPWTACFGKQKQPRSFVEQCRLRPFLCRLLVRSVENENELSKSFQDPHDARSRVYHLPHPIFYPGFPRGRQSSRSSRPHQLSQRKSVVPTGRAGSMERSDSQLHGHDR